jgi:hypothetical protein
MSRNVVCPYCNAEYKPHLVYPRSIRQTLAYYPPTIYKNNVNINEDRNRTTTEYECSNNHIWTIDE